MKTNNAYLFILCMMLVVSCVMMAGCGNGSSGSDAFVGDTVLVDSYKLSDSSSFLKSNGDRCNVIVDASVAIPIKFGTNTDVNKLNDKLSNANNDLERINLELNETTNKFHAEEEKKKLQEPAETV